MTQDVHIIGGGLAGSEAAWQLGRRGFRVRLSEMRGTGERSPAHQGDGLAELVCSNSFRSDDHEKNAVGLLHEEMRRCDSLIMAAAGKAQVPAGTALAVDRDVFSAEVEARLSALPNVEIVRERIDTLPESGTTIVATGPLTADSLAGSIGRATGSDSLAFFDAIAPIVYRESIDMDVCWMASRWDKGETKDYINCPMDKDQYLAFHQALLEGEKTAFKEWEADTPYFDGCMPIEVMAERGVETLRFGPMKPVGLDNPHWATEEHPKGRWAYAVVQLRQDNKLGTLWNMVGFQTKLKHAEQVRLFRTIPGLENAEFARLGGLHRNTFINSPVLLDRQLRLKTAPHVRFAGQITGCEGYVESAAVGLMAGLMTATQLAGRDWQAPPRTTALGALLSHITGDAEAESYQPMNVNFGLFPPLHDVKKKQRKEAYTERAKHEIAPWLDSLPAG
ncbi:MAG: methylenetetrahydrofolate--tRNA-((54)-C(5))-methyltransferase ((2)-oxidizing) TrmFO [Novosphingobium lindaniclasticum]|jgi:methylenetetrahydrofolate--tRNA-(uracil-5-)-methyltransferase|uniref:Methylenetetrahydrofolate--tRNA-(uracil-5-)-methyltransferase TrmFO n=1 Tax=Novosphingobium lindaniclasticum LE124 TaxID=1096930 RepID=T0HA60_9SPHN|nr:methylenetetrahydrofolate--tRNA-(uracil(54)-C(5))-methyltransferase (FADH(2)-oxidizing) TrmFO [Novosphingobium lindaniclasticum]EQB09023.1 tRNA (uracil-5-)-methyltransferase [Novosphingobium lindaniclasticum LE124]MDF2640039.1 methylenetetrahydrofolate--tRNA-((54)-C(5))-methyltransferase ((2)-oxidizing) TrmFO [Novosphingobium lindaniclasticum]